MHETMDVLFKDAEDSHLLSSIKENDVAYKCDFPQTSSVHGGLFLLRGGHCFPIALSRTSENPGMEKE